MAAAAGISSIEPQGIQHSFLNSGRFWKRCGGVIKIYQAAPSVNGDFSFFDYNGLLLRTTSVFQFYGTQHTNTGIFQDPHCFFRRIAQL